MVLESTLAIRTFEVDQTAPGEAPMVYAPQGQSGHFFNRQEREVRSFQLVEALTFSKNDWLGQHVFKAGLDLQHSRFDGSATASSSTCCASTAPWPSARPTRRALTQPEVSGMELAVFAQDRWRVSDRLNLEFGFRADRDAWSIA